MKIFVLFILAILFSTNISIADIYYCEAEDSSGIYKVEYNPNVNECNYYLNTNNMKTDPGLILIMAMSDKKVTEQEARKCFQQQYNSCMKSRRLATEAYRKGQCKKLQIKRYNVGSQKCEDRYLNGKKIFGSCTDNSGMQVNLK